MKNILLIESDKEQGKVFANWLKEEGYEVILGYDSEDAYSLLSKERSEIVIIDIDSPEDAEASVELCRRLKREPRFSDLPVILLTYKKDGRKIADALEAGVDNFMLKPFETELFATNMTVLFKEIEIRRQGKKVLDLNHINYLIGILGDINREDFFVLAPVIFNKLVMDRIQGVIGEPVISLLLKRLEKIMDRDHEFLRKAKLQNGYLIMNGADEASKDVPVRTLTVAFRDYIYAFLHLVTVLTSDILVEGSAFKSG